MSYCTRQNLLDRFGEQELIQLTDRDALGIIDEAVLAEAIGDADAEVNSYLTAYTLPLAVVPANLTRLACDMVRYHLHGNMATEAVKTRYDDAIKYLSQVAKGVFSLGPDASGATAPAASDTVAFESAVPVFGRGGW